MSDYERMNAAMNATDEQVAELVRVAESMSPSLPEFLRTCIAEDEAVAREVIDYRQSQLAPEYLTEPDFGIGPNVDVMGPDVRIGVDRVLAECEAKRRIVEVLTDSGQVPWDRMASANRDVLMALALPYVDRPGFREEWRP